MTQSEIEELMRRAARAGNYYQFTGKQVERLAQFAKDAMAALERIAKASRGVPDSLGCDRFGNCNMSDCECSNHIANKLLAAYHATPQENVK